VAGGRPHPDRGRSDQWALAGRGLTPGHGPPSLFFWNFFNLFQAPPILWSIFIGNLGNGLGLLGESVHYTPIFSSFPLHLEVSNLPFLIEFGDFTFFEILFFLNLE
jgi:hypothetical protein